MCVHRTVRNCCTQYCTEQTDSFPPYPPDNHHYSDYVYLREGGGQPPPNFRSISVAAKWLHASRYVTWYGARPRPRRLCVRWGPRCPLPKRGRTPQIFGHIYCDQTAGWMKLVLGMVVVLSPGEFVLNGDPVPLPQKGQSPLPNFKG